MWRGASGTGCRGPRSAGLYPSCRSTLLSIQEVGDSTAERNRRRVRRWGEDLLDQLDHLRLGLVLGSVRWHELEWIAQLVERQRAQVDDPLLTAVLDEIELRARVGIAKFGRNI